MNADQISVNLRSSALTPLVPIHQAASLDQREAGTDPCVRVTQPKAHDIVRSAKPPVAAGERLQVAALQNSITIEVRPDLFLSPAKPGCEMDEDIRRYQHEPKHFRIEMDVLDDPDAVFQESILNLEARKSPAALESEF